MGFLSLLEGDKSRSLQPYSVTYVIVNGSTLTQEASVTLAKKSNSTPMHTLAAGLAGVSQGSGLIELTIENAVPSADFEWCPDVILREGSPVEIGIVMAGRQCVFAGFVMDATYSHSVNDSSKLTMSLICRFASFE